MIRKHRSIFCILLAVLLTAALLTGCTPAEKATETAASQTEAPVGSTPAETKASPATKEAPQTSIPEGAEELGEGSKLIYFTATFADGRTSSYAIHTDAETVGDALIAYDLIKGDPGDYGLYVTIVCGEALDWDADHMYWAFYENGEYAMTGVDATPVSDGMSYAFVATEG